MLGSLVAEMAARCHGRRLSVSDLRHGQLPVETPSAGERVSWSSARVGRCEPAAHSVSVGKNARRMVTPVQLAFAR